MLTDITITPMYVTDQDAALAFYCDKLGFVLDTDADLGHMRWLTVRLPAAPQRAVLLQRIGDATATGSPETADLLRELTERGATSWMILASDDVRADHERLVRPASRSPRSRSCSRTARTWPSETPSATRSGSPSAPRADHSPPRPRARYRSGTRESRPPTG